MAKVKGNLFLTYQLLILFISFVIGVPIIEAAETPLVNQLPPGMVIGDDKGIEVKEDGKYLMEVNDVAPGKKWKTEVTLLNVEKNSLYAVSMKISPPKNSGPINLAEAISMKLTYVGKVIYEGPLSGVSKSLNMQKDYVELGNLASGDSRGLTVELEMDHTYTNNDFMVKSMTDNIWEFRAVKAKEKPKNDDPKDKPHFLPQTGEEWRNVLIGICLGLFILMLVLLILKKKREGKLE